MCVLCVPIIDEVLSAEVGGNETQFTLRELQPNQVYRLRIAAGTGIGFGVPSEWAQHKTLARHSNHSMGKEDIRPCPFLKFSFVLFWIFLLLLLLFCFLFKPEFKSSYQDRKNQLTQSFLAVKSDLLVLYLTLRC